MKILILGETGFIGKNLLSRLKADPNHQVTAIARSTGVDLLDYKQVVECLQENNPEVIYNLASHGGSLHYVKEFAADVFADNVQMALNLYRATKEVCPNAKIINPFSNCSYPGDSDVQNEENWLNGGVHESIFSFGNSKRSIFYLSWCYHKQHGIKTVNLLFPNTFGPGDSCDPNKTHALNGIIIRMLKAKKAGDKEFVIWGTGAPVREWAYVDDFIEGLVRAMGIDHLEYPANIGQQKGYSILDSAKMVKEACGFEGELVHDTRFPDGDPVKILGNSKFNDLFPNFEFFDHEEGIKNTVSYYMDKV